MTMLDQVVGVVLSLLAAAILRFFSISKFIDLTAQISLFVPVVILPAILVYPPLGASLFRYYYPHYGTTESPQDETASVLNSDVQSSLPWRSLYPKQQQNTKETRSKYEQFLKMVTPVYNFGTVCFAIDAACLYWWVVEVIPNTATLRQFLGFGVVVSSAHCLHHLYLLSKPKERKVPMNKSTENDPVHVGDDRNFPKAGIRVSYIVDEFIPACGGKEALVGLQTHQVKEKFIKSMTAGSKSSVCDMLKEEGRNDAYGDQATVFLSHAHSYHFLDVVSALQWHLRNEPDTIVWFDMFSINQHITGDWSFEWLSTTFRSAVGRFGRVIQVMSPWYDPIPFTRAWCVFEAFCAAVTKSKFEIAMSETDQRQFLKDVQANPQGSINHMLAMIRAEKSQCSVESDKVQIFKTIRQSVGFPKLDSMVLECYRGWVVQVTHDALKKSSNIREQFSLCATLGQVLEGQGRFDAASTFWTHAFDIAKEHYDTGSVEHLQCLHNLASLASKTTANKNNKDLKKVQRQYKQMLKKQLAIPSTSLSSRPILSKFLGKKHIKRINTPEQEILSKCVLAEIYFSPAVDKPQKARAVLEECWEESKKQFGFDHHLSLKVMFQLAQANIIFFSQKYEALSLIEKCLEMRQSKLGPDHPETLATVSALGKLYEYLGDKKAAKTILEECHDRQITILGPNHPQTRATQEAIVAMTPRDGKRNNQRPLQNFGKWLDNTKKDFDNGVSNCCKALVLIAFLYFIGIFVFCWILFESAKFSYSKLASVDSTE